MKLVTIATITLGALCASTIANAGGVRSRRRGANTVHKGLNEIGVQSLASLSQVSQDGGASGFFTAVAGATFRRFYSDNLAYSANASFTYRSPGDDTAEKSGMGVASIHYYQRLGEGMFLAPGFGAGLVFGNQETPQGPQGAISRVAFSGGVVRLSLPVVLYAWEKFNVQGGPEMLTTFASTSPAVGEGAFFTRIDAGFSVGVSMYF